VYRVLAEAGAGNSADAGLKKVLGFGKRSRYPDNLGGGRKRGNKTRAARVSSEIVNAALEICAEVIPFGS